MEWAMDRDVWPKDPRSEAALVALALAEIMDQTPADAEILITDFLLAAWPSPRAQRQ
jgi:hypothetical protein